MVRVGSLWFGSGRCGSLRVSSVRFVSGRFWSVQIGSCGREKHWRDIARTIWDYMGMNPKYYRLYGNEPHHGYEHVIFCFCLYVVLVWSRRLDVIVKPGAPGLAVACHCLRRCMFDIRWFRCAWPLFSKIYQCIYEQMTYFAETWTQL